MATPTASLSEGEAALARALTDYIPHVMRQHSTPGLAIAVSQDRRIIYDAGFGYKDIQSRAPMTADTTFFTGSMAKTVVAFAAMQLVEEGVLELDVPVNQYLTAFQIENPLGGGDVTLRHLLTHQTGLSTNPGGGLFPAEQPVPLLEEHLTNSYENAPEFNLLYHGTLSPTWGAPVGEKWQYSNRGTATIGYLVEIMNPDGLSLEAYLDQKVFGPLSMNDTQHPVLITEEYTRADLWERRSLGNTRVGQFLFGDSHKIGLEAPAGGIITTVSDFVRLPMAFIEGGTLDGGTIAAPETIEAMLTPAFDVGDYDQGLMWKLDRDENDHPFRFWHPGGAPNGHTNVFGGWPALGMATVMHTNSWPISSGRYEDMYQIEDFILRWKAEEQELGHPPEFRSWAWKTSYVLALLSVEAEASVGTPRSHFEEYLDTRITLGSVRYGHPSMSNLWDENGFRAGVTDAFPATGEVTMSHIENLANGGLAISKGDFLEIYANLGGAGSMIPNFWE
ncbi:serine hydrolase [Tropicibacter sp. R16_0]|uniref:serine hydrolase domain-containing protein n=1 Tax=Tropicibacter sp. R16_0 TaxID=2821102 RepID=UPI001AD966D2|nr:serine hydrolase [Tropicibacter sp. R16_0]